MMNSLRSALIKSGAIKPANLKIKKTKFRATKRKDNLIPYRELQNHYVFRRYIHGEGVRVFTKVSDAFAIDEKTGDDAIFLHHELVEPLYPATTGIGDFCCI